ncbi:MAG TPA: response regulator [Polyangiaceae bacterium]|nr:response regulator [Polyangiaceae bacterium]
MATDRILLVDDDPDIRTIASMALRAWGKFEVVSAESGEAALEMALSANHDLLLMDVMMPRLDGIGVASELRARGVIPNVPLIFLTAKAEPRDIELYLDLGAIGVIVKPFEPGHLAREARRLLGICRSVRLSVRR